MTSPFLSPRYPHSGFYIHLCSSVRPFGTNFNFITFQKKLHININTRYPISKYKSQVTHINASLNNNSIVIWLLIIEPEFWSKSLKSLITILVQILRLSIFMHPCLIKFKQLTLHRKESAGILIKIPLEFRSQLHFKTEFWLQFLQNSQVFSCIYHKSFPTSILI